MSIKAEIIDGRGSGRSANVDITGALATALTGFPPFGDPLPGIIFRDFFKNSAGTSDMRVNGATNNVEFVIAAPTDPDEEIYISTLSFTISDANSKLDNFGAIAALTNGVLFSYDELDKGRIVVHEGLKRNFDFIRLCQGQPAFGDGVSAFRGNNIEGNSEGYIPSLDIRRVFGLPYGIRLKGGTNVKLALTVRDDITGVDAFNVVAYGFKIFKPNNGK